MNDSTAVRTDASCSQRIIDAHNTGMRARLGYATWADYLASEWDLFALSTSQLKAVSGALRAVGMSGPEVMKIFAAPRQAARLADDLAAEMRTASTHVYLVGSKDFSPVKIGVGNPQKRLAEFQVGNPFDLELLWTTPGGPLLEKALHSRFNLWYRRGEWFDFPSGVDPVQCVSRTVAALARTAAPTV